jgi:hypothetical protein
MLFTLLPLVLGALVAPQSPAPSASPPSEKLPLRVLYAGNAGTPYTVAWEHFHAEHTAGVKVISGSALRRADLDGFDLLVVDGEVESRNAKGEPSLKSEKFHVTLDELQGFPIVMVGGQGGFFADEMHLKTSWHHG